MTMERLRAFPDTSLPNTSLARSRWRATLLAAALLASAGASAAEPLVLLVQPILSEEQTRAAYTPLCAYLGRAAGRECTIRTAPNFLGYWETMRRNQGYDLALDAAHFTDYRIQKLGFEVLAKIPGTVSYSLVVLESSLVLDPEELIGKPVATLGAPSIGAARLNGMYPNPLRQPAIVSVDNAEEGVRALLNKRARAAILPTPIIAREIQRGAGLFIVTTTDPIPHIALSASQRVPPALREQLRRALIDADKSIEGRQMLKAIGFERFDPGSAEIYASQSRLLKEYWGF